MHTFSHADDELLDVVDEHDQVIGQDYRSNIYAQGKRNFRAVNAFLINSSGQLLIMRRSAHKKLFPLCLDASVGGHVKAGESHQEAFERELLEELALNACEVGYAFFARLSPLEHQISCHMHVYIIYADSIPEYNTDDFIDAFWLTIPEILIKLKQGEKAKDDLPILVAYLDKYLK